MAANIQTNVDKLVTLVSEYERISLRDAAKKLAVPVSTVEEWAHLLEEESVLHIDYRLGTPFLVRNKLTDEQKQEKVRQFESDEVLFQQKVEAAASYFNELDKKINLISHMFEDMEGNIDSKLLSVNSQITGLTQAERKKELLDTQILEAKERAVTKIREIDTHLKKVQAEYRMSYAHAKSQLDVDKTELTKDEKFLDKIREQELQLQERLRQVRDLSAQIQAEVAKRSGVVKETESHILSLKNKHDMLQYELEKEHEALQAILERNSNEEKQIEHMQQELFKKLTEQEAELSRREKEIRSIPDHFKQLFSHRAEIREIINTIQNEEAELKREIEDLRHSAHHLELALGKEEFEKELTHLSTRIDGITAKRAFFKEKVTKLMHLLDHAHHEPVA